MDSLTVSLAERSYPIHFGRDLSAELARAIAERQAAGSRVAALVDATVGAAQAPFLQAALAGVPTLAVPGGEGSKSLETFGRVLEFLAENRIDRRGALIAVGGGVIGDLGGFAAAAYLRGVDFLQVPTTLLAMVDSSVGGKTGINLAAGKNLAGAFHQPRAVFVSTGLLGTLPAREFAAGMAEVVKYGLLGDASLFSRLSADPLTPSHPALTAVIRRCCELKAAVVQADERELAEEGGRALLNLGHTFGHAIEHAAGYGVYLHGEAVAIGLAAAARLSLQLGHLGAAEVTAVEKTLVAHSLPTRLRQPLPLGTLGAALARDKKVRGGLPRFIVLEKLGRAVTRAGLDPARIDSVWREVGAL